MEGLVAEILYIGSPIEYVLFQQMEEEGLPEGAGKHMLRLKSKPEKEGLIKLLRYYATAHPLTLPKEPRPHRGIDDVHEIRLKEGTKLIAIPPYRWSP